MNLLVSLGTRTFQRYCFICFKRLFLIIFRNLRNPAYLRLTHPSNEKDRRVQIARLWRRFRENLLFSSSQKTCVPKPTFICTPRRTKQRIRRTVDQNCGKFESFINIIESPHLMQIELFFEQFLGV